jgi:hypothetical protein
MAFSLMRWAKGCVASKIALTWRSRSKVTNVSPLNRVTSTSGAGSIAANS